jgi:ABC-2 type transport system ATP-binding protein
MLPAARVRFLIIKAPMMQTVQPVVLSGIQKAFVRPDCGDGIVAQVSFHVSPGGCVSLVGDNGSGKSTILRIACGLVHPDRGTVQVFGANPATDGRVRARIAALFEGGRALHARLTPAENVAYFSCLKGFDKHAAMRRFRELSARFSIQHYGNVVVRKLSRGTQQKFSLISALATGAELWLLDEPTLGMDEASVEILGDIVRDHLRLDGAVLMATHDVRFAASLGHIVNVTDFQPSKASASAPLSQANEQVAAK